MCDISDFYFFFSSRRRHTRLQGDWSSDVCSSDLGEALYADLGHFGHRAIQIAWFSTAFPCLLLNYFGQGALLLRDPTAAQNPFYHLAPGWALYPLIALATAAAIIASQAVISGAFSLTRTAGQHVSS